MLQQVFVSMILYFLLNNLSLIYTKKVIIREDLDQVRFRIE